MMERPIIRKKAILIRACLALCLLQSPVAFGQKYYSKTGKIHFESHAPLEKIESSNPNAMVVLDATTGQMEWSVLIKGFQFEKALMQEHFNENYMESHTYPKGIFKGTILNLKDIPLNRDGQYTAQVQGELTLHGVTKSLTVTGQVLIKAGKISLSSTFELMVADFRIEIPKLVKDNIAKVVKVSVTADLQELKS